MTTGIILAIIFIFMCLKFVTKRFNNRKVDAWMVNIHKIVGFILLIIAMLHMIITLTLIKQRPISMYFAGIIMITCILAAIFSFLFRKKLKKNWIRIHRTATVILMLCLIFHCIVGINSLNSYHSEMNNIEIHNIDLNRIADGKYLGEYDVGYIYAKVEVTIEAGKIKAVSLLEHRNERGKRAESLIDTIVQEQKNKVDAVSGATNSSKVIMKAVENAISKGMK